MNNKKKQHTEKKKKGNDISHNNGILSFKGGGRAKQLLADNVRLKEKERT